MKAHLIRLSLTAVICASLATFATPLAAQTTATSWQASSTLDPNIDATAKELTINIARCRALVEANRDYTFTFRKTQGTFGSRARYAIKVAVGNESCDKNSLSEEAGDTCLTEIADQSLDESTVPIDVTLAFHRLTSAKSLEDCENLTETSYVHLIAQDPGVLETDPKTYTVTFTNRFKTTRPAAPTNVTANGGESSIAVSWDGVSGIENYVVYYSANPFDNSTRPEDLVGVRSHTARKTTSTAVRDGITVDTTYYLAVAAVDDVGNESMLSPVVTTVTGAADDFWERYSAANPDVDGGFCFLATAAWGSYQEPHVQVLRRFRDTFLLTHPLGEAFVTLYYELSPPAAHFIAQHPTLRAVTRTILWPLYAFAILCLYGSTLGLFALLLTMALTLHLLHRIWRRRRQRRAAMTHPNTTPRRLAALATAALLCLPALTYAQESPIDMMLELKMGPYQPDQLGSVYDDFFGDASPLLFEIELDYQFYRGIGSLAVGGSLAYGSVSGNARTPDDEASIDETSLSWLPLRLALIYRFDYLMQHFNIPFTIFAKGGLDYAFWWVRDGAGDIAQNDAGKNGSGGTFGWHFCLGGAFLLDWLAPDMARSLDVEWGINHAYIFAEFLYTRLDDFGAATAFDLSNTGTFQIGLALEF